MRYGTGVTDIVTNSVTPIAKRLYTKNLSRE